MRSYLEHFIAVLALLFTLNGKAQQLIISKDYNNCLYGLMDHSGHWVVPARYTEIGNFEGRFAIVMLNNKYGLINAEGKETLPPVYSRLSRFYVQGRWFSANGSVLQAGSFSESNKGLYRAFKNNLSGIIDTSGKEIVPIAYTYLDEFYNGVAFASRDGKQKIFLDLHGIRGALRVKYTNQISTEYAGIGVYRVWEWTGTDKARKCLFGLVDDSARLILPCIYDSINQCAGYKGIVEVYKEGKTGYFTKEGKPLFDVRYSIPGAGQHVVPVVVTEGAVPAFDGQYWGVLKSNGTFAIPFQYEALKAYPFYFGYNQYCPVDSADPVWQVKQNGKWGVLSRNGKQLLPALYTDILSPCMKFSSRPSEYIFEVKSQEGWGAVSSSGQMEMPCVYDTLLPTEDGYLFCSELQVDLFSMRTSGNFVLIYKYNPDALEEEYKKKWQEENPGKDLSEMPGVLRDSFYMSTQNYRGEGEEFYYFNENNPKDYQYGRYMLSSYILQVTHMSLHLMHDKGVFLCLDPAYPANKKIYFREGLDMDVPGAPRLLQHKDKKWSLDQAGLLAADSVYSWYSFGDFHTGILRSDGQVLLEPGKVQNVHCINTTAAHYFVVEAVTHSLKGMMDADGKMLLDTVWSDIGQLRKDEIWVRKNSAECENTWNLFSLRTKKLRWPKETELLRPLESDSGIFPVSTIKGTGLFNAYTLSFVTQPAAAKFYPLYNSSGRYLVETCSGKAGMMNSSGAWETDTCWKQVIHLSHTPIGDPRVRKVSEDRYMLLNDSSWAIYDNHTGKLENHRATDTTIAIHGANAQSGYEQEHYMYGMSEYCPDCPYLGGNAVLLFFSPWQSRLLFNSLFRSETTPDLRQQAKPVYSECSCAAGDSPYELNNPGFPKSPVHVQHILHFVSDSCLSLAKSTSPGHELNGRVNRNFQWNDSFMNYFLFPGGLRNYTLDSLFTGQAWRKVIIDETLNFLTTHPGIETDCSNPSAYPQMLNKVFLIDTEGITFYTHWQKRDSTEQVTFSIPWEKLKPYLRKDLLTKIPMH